jgi:hypothetical protein
LRIETMFAAIAIVTLGAGLIGSAATLTNNYEQTVAQNPTPIVGAQPVQSAKTAIQPAVGDTSSTYRSSRQDSALFKSTPSRVPEGAKSDNRVRIYGGFEE